MPVTVTLLPPASPHHSPPSLFDPSVLANRSSLLGMLPGCCVTLVTLQKRVNKTLVCHSDPTQEEHMQHQRA
jgi:hypothetical protein